MDKSLDELQGRGLIRDLPVAKHTGRGRKATPAYEVHPVLPGGPISGG